MVQHRSSLSRRRGDLIRAARTVRQSGRSYRGFKVGAAVLAFNSRQYRIFVGCNLKPAQGGPKICAEMAALTAAYAARYFKIIAIAVVGAPREEDETPTLWPCAACLEMFRILCQPEMTIITKYNGHGDSSTLRDLLTERIEH